MMVDVLGASSIMGGGALIRNSGAFMFDSVGLLMGSGAFMTDGVGSLMGNAFIPNLSGYIICPLSTFVLTCKN